MDLVLTDAQVADVRAGVSEAGRVNLTLSDLQVSAVVGASSAVVVPEIVSFPLNLSAITADIVQYAGGRYSRYQDPLILAPGVVLPGAPKNSPQVLDANSNIRLPFQLTNQAAGGEQRAPLPYARYSLRVSPVEQGTDGVWRKSTKSVERAAYVPFASRGQAITFSGTMPFGLTLSSDGTISGTPTTTGTKDVNVTATIGTDKVIADIFIAVGSTTAVMYSGRPPIAKVGVPYSFSLADKPFEAVGTFTGQLGDEPDGLYIFEIWGQQANGGEVLLMMHGGYVDRNGTCKDCPVTIMQNGSRDWESMAGMMKTTGLPVVYQYAIVPKALAYTTRVKPLVRRLGVQFNAMPLDASRWTRVNYVFPTFSVSRTPCLTRGITITENLQYYHFSKLTAVAPALPMLDGPRGICTAPFTTHMRFGRLGKIYGHNPWQAWVMDDSGTKRTLYGIRHKYAPYWQEGSLDGPEVERVGDWDPSIPVNERHAWEPWGMVWDEASLFPIDDAAPIPPGETEHPHTGLGPRHFVTDRHGYVLEVQFSAVAHGNNPVNPQPAKIRRWAACSDPWGMDADQKNRVLYVSERGRDAISMWSMDTPNTHLGDLLANPNPLALGRVYDSDRHWVGAGLDATRAQQVVGPEGIVIQDGYLYWGSLAQSEVRRIPLTGGPIEVVCRPATGNNANYVLLAISDGSFGPRGMLAVTTWSNGNSGRPRLFYPGATRDDDGAFVKRTVTSDGTTPILGKVYAAGTIVTVYDALDATGRVTGTYKTQLEAQMANGTPMTHTEWTKFAGFEQGVVKGIGPNWESGSYASAPAIGYPGNPSRTDDPPYGAMACTSADGEVTVYMQADASDGVKPDYVKAERGLFKYFTRFQILHGAWCSGPDLPLPWGQDPDVDYFMETLCGQSR